jgi:acyl carrier protein
VVRSGVFSGDNGEVGDEMAASREEIYEQVKGVLVDQLGIEESEITEEASFQEDLDADSLDLVELIMELEDSFGVKISDEDAQGIQTVGQAVAYIAAHQ